MPETVLVAGGGGSLGLAAVRALTARGDRVRTFSRRPHPALKAMPADQPAVVAPTRPGGPADEDEPSAPLAARAFDATLGPSHPLPSLGSIPNEQRTGPDGDRGPWRRIAGAGAAVGTGVQKPGVAVGGFFARAGKAVAGSF